MLGSIEVGEKQQQVKKMIESLTIYSELQVLETRDAGSVYKGCDTRGKTPVWIRVRYVDSTMHLYAGLNHLIYKQLVGNLVSSEYPKKAIPRGEGFLILDSKGKALQYIAEEVGVGTTSLTQMLANTLRRKGLEFAPEKTSLVSLVEDISSVLLKMHTNHIAHLDIKPSNIVYVASSKQFLLDGFSMAEQYEECSSMLDFTTTVNGSGTSVYRSPLMQKQGPGQVHNPFKSDMFMLGMTLLNAYFVQRISHEDRIRRKDQPLSSFSDGVIEDLERESSKTKRTSPKE